MYVIGLVVGKLKPELENSVYLFLTNNIFMSPQLTFSIQISGSRISDILNIFVRNDENLLNPYYSRCSR